ncbi:MAG: DUF934 domain-containing protein [Alphaproteobacteria bacterium]
MVLNKDGQKLVEDSFTLLADDDALNNDQAQILPLARFLDAVEDGSLNARTAPLGVLLAPADDTRALVDHLGKLALIAIDFPQYKDGRGFTHARLLREQLGWTGELRAVGDVLFDQLNYMLRTGFSTFDVRKAYDVEHFADAINAFTEAYQQPGDGRITVIEKRHAVG